jgi:hypothetical protein
MQEEHMPKRRTNISLTEKQLERLQARSEQENLPMAELIRRALDAFLAWDDPTYHPSSQAPNKERRLHPHA